MKRADEGDEDKPDDDIDRRPGDRDGELLRRPARQPLHTGDAADRQQRDFRRLDAEAARRQDMAEFMQHDADEHEHDEDDRCRAPPPAPPCHQALKPIQASSSRKVT